MLVKQHLKELVEKILPGLAKQRRREEEEDRQTRWFIEQKRKCEAGEEVEPPWVTFPNAQPGGWNQGYQEVWKSDVWIPFWNNLSNEERREYLERWHPSEDWYESLVSGERGSLPNGETDWFKEQEKKLKAGEEIEPPWFAFPVSYASYGWNSSATEKWKLEIWIPFWKKLNQTDKEKYLEKWQPPNEDWLKLITIDWTGKLRKANYWYNNQKENYQWNNYVQVPWSAFPNNPTVYEWEEGEREKWLINIWLPFWHEMSEESQDEYLEYKNPPDTEWLEILEKHKVKNLNKLKEIKPPGA